MAGGRAGRESCAGAGLTSARTAVRRGGMALRTALALAVGADGVGAVVVDGHLGGLGSAGRALDGAAALWLEENGFAAHVSLSHEGGMAAAFVVLEVREKNAAGD